MAYTVPVSSIVSYSPEKISSFFVYAFEWIDNLHFILPAKKFLTDSTAHLETARKAFLKAGWDGDGEIGLLWLPNFIFPIDMWGSKSEIELTAVTPAGIVLWHVKQEEDGISFLLSPIKLPFESLG